MLFNSYVFLLFLGITLGIYYLPWLRKYQIGVLLLASSVFYAFHSLSLLLLLAASIGIAALSSYAVVYFVPAQRRWYAALGVGANLSILIFFKYGSLLGRTFFGADQPLGDFLLTIPLPLGISFYTFQGISLLVDTFRATESQTKAPEGKQLVVPAFVKHLRQTSLYLSFFPQLVAGPIVKSQQFMPQIGPKVLAQVDWEYCFRNLVVGYFLKMVVADNLKTFTFWIEYPHFLNYQPIDLFVMLLGYSCQIFADFAGYSSIAIGLAGLFGYRLPVNFNYPYIARSFRDFWRRWHITLSSFLAEYLYLPLGGNRRGRVRTYFNILVVMLLGGLWHGAAWSYLIWGLAHGIFLSGERFTFETLGWDRSRFGNIFYSVFVFLAVTLAWLLFRLPFEQALLYLGAMFTQPTLSFNVSLVLHLLLYSFPVMLYHAHGLLREKNLPNPFQRYESGVLALMLFLIVFNSGPAGAFIYFQF